MCSYIRLAHWEAGLSERESAKENEIPQYYHDGGVGLLPHGADQWPWHDVESRGSFITLALRLLGAHKLR